MAKKKIEIILKSSENVLNKNMVAIITDDTIKFSDSGIKVVLKICDTQVTMVRENDEYQLCLNFRKNKKTKGTYLLKEYKTTFSLDILTQSLEVKDSSVVIRYQLNDELYDFTLYVK